MRTAKGDAIFFVPPYVEVEADTIARLADRLEESEAIGAVCPFCSAGIDCRMRRRSSRL